MNLVSSPESRRLRRVRYPGGMETNRELSLAPRHRAAHPAQVRQVVHAQSRGGFSQTRPAGGKEPAQQRARGQLLQPRVPALRVASQPLEDPRQVGGDRGLALAEESPGVLDQQQVITQRESLDHSFARRIQPPAILDRTEPEPLFQARRDRRARDAAGLGGLQILGSPLLLNVLDPLLDRRIRAGLGALGNAAATGFRSM